MILHLIALMQNVWLTSFQVKVMVSLTGELSLGRGRITSDISGGTLPGVLYTDPIVGINIKTST